MLEQTNSILQKDLNGAHETFKNICEKVVKETTESVVKIVTMQQDALESRNQKNLKFLLRPAIIDIEITPVEKFSSARTPPC